MPVPGVKWQHQKKKKNQEKRIYSCKKLFYIYKNCNECANKRSVFCTLFTLNTLKIPFDSIEWLEQGG